MKKAFFFWLNHYVFWIVCFFVFRVIMLFYSGVSSEINGFTGAAQTLTAGYKLDFSVASYLFVLPLLMLVLSKWTGTGVFLVPYKIYHILTSVLIILILNSNIILYKVWGTLINNRALSYLQQPKEVFASATNTELFVVFLFIGLIIWLSIIIYNRFVIANFAETKISLGKLPVVLVAGFGITFIGIRGGLQLIPVNESSAVFSQNHNLNQVAINPVWYLVHNLKELGLDNKNPYEFMPDDDAERITNNILKKHPVNYEPLFNSVSKPNVVIILLESWTADVIEPLGGIEGVTPNFTKLSKEGLLFSNAYSSGFRTDQALVSVLSGFPAQPNKSIIRFPSKIERLPGIAGILKKSGYQNSFYYGGELGFANMRNYLVSTGVNNIVSIDDFNGYDKSKWGVHDETIFSRHSYDLDQFTQPFFSTLLTIDTHEPFEVPLETPFSGDEESEKFKKAAWYTDHYLGLYFEKIKKAPWYDNTIFLLVADHGHRLPLNRDYFDPLARRIPMLILGNPLSRNYRGKTIDNLCNQNDITSTLVRNLGYDDSEFKWSVDILDTLRTNFVYLSHDAAFSWITPGSRLLIPLQEGIVPSGTKNPEQEKNAEAYLQQLYRTFLSY